MLTSYPLFIKMGIKIRNTDENNPLQQIKHDRWIEVKKKDTFNEISYASTSGSLIQVFSDNQLYNKLISRQFKNPHKVKQYFVLQLFYLIYVLLSLFYSEVDYTNLIIEMSIGQVIWYIGVCLRIVIVWHWFYMQPYILKTFVSVYLISFSLIVLII